MKGKYEPEDGELEREKARLIPAHVPATSNNGSEPQQHGSKQAATFDLYVNVVAWAPN